MNFSTQQDIDVPISSAFDLLCSFQSYESAAKERGASVNRVDDLAGPGVGMKWNAEVELRGRNRLLALEITAYDPPDGLTLTGGSEGLRGDIRVDLTALSNNQTRVTLQADVRAKSIASRVLLQSLKLTKPTLDRRFEDRVATYLTHLEQRHEKGA